MKINTIKPIMLCVSMILIAPGLTFAKEWRGIVPLHSTCEDVKRILGIKKCDTANYPLEGDKEVFAVSIYFEDHTCPQGWNVPPGTVTGLSVYPRIKPRLADLHLDEKKYKKVIEGDAPANVIYTDAEEGFEIETSNGVVIAFGYSPSAKDNYLRCPNYSAPPLAEREGTVWPLVIFDKYSDLSFNEEKKRLDNFALLLKREREWVGYIKFYAGRRARVGEAKERAQRAKGYLVSKHRIESGRIVISDGGYKRVLTVELWSGPRGSSAPTPDH
jgi:hypothetical protein